MPQSAPLQWISSFLVVYLSLFCVYCIISQTMFYSFVGEKVFYWESVGGSVGGVWGW